jgi:hypothetical protein
VQSVDLLGFGFITGCVDESVWTVSQTGHKNDVRAAKNQINQSINQSVHHLKKKLKNQMTFLETQSKTHIDAHKTHLVMILL